MSDELSFLIIPTTAQANLLSSFIFTFSTLTFEEVKDAYNVLLDNGADKDRITILHCNTEYPTPMTDVNLLAMLDIKEKLNVTIGYSDHTLGIEIPIAATALGAKVIEKHFTIDRKLPGPDHKASLEPEELIAMVNAIRNIEKAINGSGLKEPSSSELKNRPIARKSIVAIDKISMGEAFTDKNIGVKRPGTGLSPMKWDQIMGSNAKKSYDFDELIEL